jgi:hypothetical protein
VTAQSQGLPKTPFVVALFFVLASSAGAVSQPRPIEPGGNVGTMRLVRGTVARADAKLFDFCEPVITKAGGYQRTCLRVPKVRRLFVGYGSFFADPAELSAYWKSTRWQMWLDGRAVALRAFGTSDRTLVAYPPAGGVDATLREWKVMAVGPTIGRHTIRYRIRAGALTTDATWVFRVYRP